MSTVPHEYSTSRKVTAALTGALLAGISHGVDGNNAAKSAKRAQAATRLDADRQALSQIQRSQSDPAFYHRMAFLQEKESSSWVSAVPLAEHDLFLHKTSFRDCLAFRYGWQVPHLPERCVCGVAFSTDHAMVCKVGGFPVFRHNLIRDFTAECLR